MTVTVTTTAKGRYTYWNVFSFELVHGRLTINEKDKGPSLFSEEEVVSIRIVGNKADGKDRKI